MRPCALAAAQTELLMHCSYQCLQRGRSFKPRAIHPAGSEDVVELLLAAKADPNTAALGGATALHAAAAGGNLTIVLALLQVRRCTWPAGLLIVSHSTGSPALCTSCVSRQSFTKLEGPTHQGLARDSQAEGL